MSEEALSELHKLLIDELTKLIKNGEYTSQDLSVIRQLLKDNNITGTNTGESGIANLVEALRNQDEQERNELKRVK